MASPGNIQSAEQLSASIQRTRRILFALLFIVCSLPLFPFIADKVSVPNKPIPATMDFYSNLMAIPDGSTILLESDWTTSTRGENGGEFDAVVRILMRKNCKMAIYCMDPQAPKVALDTIDVLNDERTAHNQRRYERWNDYVSVGYFPNVEAIDNAMAASLVDAWTGKKDVTPQGVSTDIFQSPVLKNVKAVGDAAAIVIVTGTSSFTTMIERLLGKVPLYGMVTGVMGPESMNNYAAKQVVGLVVGMKGVYDIETMMEYGVNKPGPNEVFYPGHPPVENFPGLVNFGKGKLYYPTLHAAIILLIIAVIVGNVGMFRARRKAAR